MVATLRSLGRGSVYINHAHYIPRSPPGSCLVWINLVREPIERLIIDRFGPKEVRPCTKKRFEELQEKGLHNHIWD